MWDTADEPFLGFPNHQDEFEPHYRQFEMVRKLYMNPRVALERISRPPGGNFSVGTIFECQLSKLRRESKVSIEEVDTKRVSTNRVEPNFDSDLPDFCGTGKIEANHVRCLLEPDSDSSLLPLVAHRETGKCFGAKLSRKTEAELDTDISEHSCPRLSQNREKPSNGGSSSLDRGSVASDGAEGSSLRPSINCQVQRNVENTQRVKIRRSSKCGHLPQEEPEAKLVQGSNEMSDQPCLNDESQVCSVDHPEKNCKWDGSLLVHPDKASKDSDVEAEGCAVQPKEKVGTKHTQRHAKRSVRPQCKGGAPQQDHNTQAVESTIDDIQELTVGMKHGVQAQLGTDSVKPPKGQYVAENALYGSLDHSRKNLEACNVSLEVEPPSSPKLKEKDPAIVPPECEAHRSQVSAKPSRRRLKRSQHRLKRSRESKSQVKSQPSTGSSQCDMQVETGPRERKQKPAMDVDPDGVMGENSTPKDGVKPGQQMECDGSQCSTNMDIDSVPQVVQRSAMAECEVPTTLYSKHEVVRGEETGVINIAADVIGGAFSLTGSAASADVDSMLMNVGSYLAPEKTPEYPLYQDRNVNDSSFKGGSITDDRLESTCLPELNSALESKLGCDPSSSPPFHGYDSVEEDETLPLDDDVSHVLEEAPKSSCHGDVEFSGFDMDVCDSPLIVQNGVIEGKDERASVPIVTTSGVLPNKTCGILARSEAARLNEFDGQMEDYFGTRRVLDSPEESPGLDVEADVIDFSGTENIVQPKLNINGSQSLTIFGDISDLVGDTLPKESIGHHFSPENDCDKPEDPLEPKHNSDFSLCGSVHTTPPRKSVEVCKPVCRFGKVEEEDICTLLKPCFVRLNRMPEIENYLRRNNSIPFPIVVVARPKPSPCKEKLGRRKLKDVDEIPPKKKLRKLADGKRSSTRLDLSDGFTLKKLCELKSISLTDSSSGDEEDSPDHHVPSSAFSYAGRPSLPRRLSGRLQSDGLDLSNPVETLAELDPSVDSVVSENPVPVGVQALNELGFLDHESFQLGKDPPCESMWSNSLDFGDAAACQAKCSILSPHKPIISRREVKSFSKSSHCDMNSLLISEAEDDLEERVERFCNEFLGSFSGNESIAKPCLKGSEPTQEAKLAHLESPRRRNRHDLKRYKSKTKSLEGTGDDFDPILHDRDFVQKDEKVIDEEEKPSLNEFRKTGTVGVSEFLTSLVRPSADEDYERKKKKRGRKRKYLDDPSEAITHEKKLSPHPDSTESSESPQRRKGLYNKKLIKNLEGPTTDDEEAEAERVARELKYRLSISWMMNKITCMSSGEAVDLMCDDKELPSNEKLLRDLSTIPYVLKCNLQNRCRKCKNLNPCASSNKKFKLFFMITVGAGRKISQDLIETLKDPEDSCKINRTAAFIAASAVVQRPTTVIVPAYPSVVQKLIPTYHASLLMELVAKTEDMEKLEKKTISDMNIAEALQFKRALIAIRSRFAKVTHEPPPPMEDGPEDHSARIVLQSLQPENPLIYKIPQNVAVKSKIENKFKFVKKGLVSILPKDRRKLVCLPEASDNGCTGSSDQNDRVGHGSPFKSLSYSEHAPDVSKESSSTVDSSKPTTGPLQQDSPVKTDEALSSMNQPVPLAADISDVVSPLEGEVEPGSKKLDSGDAVKVPQIVESFSLNDSPSQGTPINDTGCSNDIYDVSSVKTEFVTEYKPAVLETDDIGGSTVASNSAQIKQEDSCENNDHQGANEETPDVIIVPEKYESIDLTTGDDESFNKNPAVPKWAAICTALPELGYIRIKKETDKLWIFDKSVVPTPIEVDSMEELSRFLNARLAELTFPNRKKITLEWIVVTSGYIIMKTIPHTNALFWLPPYTARKTLTDMRNFINRYGLNQYKPRSPKRTRSKPKNKPNVEKLPSIQMHNFGKVVRINGQSVVMGSPADYNKNLKRSGDPSLANVDSKTEVKGSPAKSIEQASGTPVIRVNGMPVMVRSPAKLPINGPISSSNPSSSAEQSIKPTCNAPGSTAGLANSGSPAVVPRCSSGPPTHMVYTKTSVGFIPLLDAGQTTIQAKITASTPTYSRAKKKSSEMLSSQSLPYVPNKKTISAPRILMCSVQRPATTMAARLSVTSGPSSLARMFTKKDATSQPMGMRLAPVSITRPVGPVVTSAQTPVTTSSLQAPRTLPATQELRSATLRFVTPPQRKPTFQSSPTTSQASLRKPFKQIVVRPGFVKYVTLSSIGAASGSNESPKQSLPPSPAASTTTPTTVPLTRTIVANSTTAAITSTPKLLASKVLPRTIVATPKTTAISNPLKPPPLARTIVGTPTTAIVTSSPKQLASTVLSQTTVDVPTTTASPVKQTAAVPQAIVAIPSTTTSPVKHTAAVTGAIVVTPNSSTTAIPPTHPVAVPRTIIAIPTTATTAIPPKSRAIVAIPTSSTLSSTPAPPTSGASSTSVVTIRAPATVTTSPRLPPSRCVPASLVTQKMANSLSFKLGPHARNHSSPPNQPILILKKGTWGNNSKSGQIKFTVEKP